MLIVNFHYNLIVKGVDIDSFDTSLHGIQLSDLRAFVSLTFWETEEVILLDCEFVSLFVERIGVDSSSDEKDHRATDQQDDQEVMPPSSFVHSCE